MAPDTIDRLTAEGPIGPTEAARVFGQFRKGAPTRRSTVVRWMLDGVRLPNGDRVRLEHYRFANRLMTSNAACLRFIRAQQQQAEEVRAPAPKRTSASAAAARELDAMGVK